MSAPTINLLGERASLIDAAAFWLDSVAFWGAIGPDGRWRQAQSARRYAAKVRQLGELAGKQRPLGVPPTWLGAREDVARAAREERARAAAAMGFGPDEPEASLPVCSNCEQWQHGGDCLNECVRRGFATKGAVS